MRSFSVWPSCTLAMACCLVACQQRQEPESAPVAPPAAPADRSLTVDEYLAIGLPKCDHAWSRLELADAAKVVESIAEDDLTKLPRFESSRSSAVFKRFVSDDCFNELLDKRVPVKERISKLVEVIGANRAIWKSYHTGFKAKSVGGTEIVELGGVQLRQAAVTVPLLEEFIPTLDPSDPSYETRIEGLRKMRQGLATMIQGALVMLTEAHLYSPDDRRRVVTNLQIAMPVVLPAIDKDRAKQLRRQLDDIVANSEYEDLRSELRELQAASQQVGHDH